jgi:hypothetical protein
MLGVVLGSQRLFEADRKKHGDNSCYGFRMRGFERFSKCCALYSGVARSCQ